MVPTQNIVLLEGHRSLGLRILTSKVLGNLTTAVLTSNILKAGYKKPYVLDIEDPVQIGEMPYCQAAFYTINHVRNFTSLKKHFDFISNRCKTLVIGGQLVSMAPEEYLEFFPTANIFVGECEGNMHWVLDKACDGDGVQGEIWRAASPANIKKDYVIPHWDRNWLVHPVEISRGCRQGCPHCAMPSSSRRFRERAPQQVIEEIRPIKRIVFVDPNLMGCSHETLDKIFSYIARTKKEWGGEGIISDALKLPEDLYKLIFSTCIGFFAGIEDPELEQLHRRKFNGTLLPKKSGFVPVYSFILGHPEQTRAHIEGIRDFIGKNKLTYVFNIFSPVCGTVAFKKANQKGILVTEHMVNFNRRSQVVRHPEWPFIKKVFEETRMEVYWPAFFREVFRILVQSKTLSLIIMRVALIYKMGPQRAFKVWLKKKRKKDTAYKCV